MSLYALEVETVTLYFLGSKITADGDCSHEIKRRLLLGRKAMTSLDSILKRRDITWSSQSYGFSSGHIWMWELDCEEIWELKNWCFWTVVLEKTLEMDHKESWAPKNWCFWTVELEKTLECPMDSKEIKSVNPRGNQPWIFTGRTDAKDEAPILWPPDVKTWLFGKDPDAGKDWRQEEKGMTDGWMAS